MSLSRCSARMSRDSAANSDSCAVTWVVFGFGHGARGSGRRPRSSQHNGRHRFADPPQTESFPNPALRARSISSAADLVGFCRGCYERDYSPTVSRLRQCAQQIIVAAEKKHSGEDDERSMAESRQDSFARRVLLRGTVSMLPLVRAWIIVTTSPRIKTEIVFPWSTTKLIRSACQPDVAKVVRDPSWQVPASDQIVRMVCDVHQNQTPNIFGEVRD